MAFHDNVWYEKPQRENTRQYFSMCKTHCEVKVVECGEMFYASTNASEVFNQIVLSMAYSFRSPANA